MELLDNLLRDIRQAARSWRKSPALAGAAIVTLALGIGANTAMFSVLEGVLLNPLPYPQPDRLALVLIYNRALRNPTYLSYPDFLDWQRAARSFEQIAAYTPHGFDLTSPGRAAHVDGDQVSSNFFGTLGVRMHLGRAISPDEDRHGGAPAVVISDRLWRDRFAASPAAIGKTLTLDGIDYTVVGVLDSGFRFDLQPADVYTAIARRYPLYMHDRTIHDMGCIARLRAGVSFSQARAEMNAVQQQIDDRNPAAERGLSAWVTPLKEALVGDSRGALLLLLGAVALVLLIACANVANLLLARSAARGREFAVRLALGAKLAQIVRQLIIESVLLSLTGAVVGLAIAQACVRAMLAAAPGSVPRADNIAVNQWALLFALSAAIAVGIVFGLLPALKNSRIDLQSGLRASGRGLGGGQQRTQRALVVVQIALALVLLTGGSLLIRTIRNLWRVNPGFETQRLLTFQVGLSPAVTNTPAKVRATFQQLAQRIGEIPGVQAADITALTPLSRNFNEGPFWLGTRPPASMAEIPRAIYYPVGPDYLRVMKIPLLRGRPLALSDALQSQPAVLIDTLLARTYFPDRDPVGLTVTIPHWGGASAVPVRIVGVVGHVEHYALDGVAGEKPEIYYSFYQLPDDIVPLFRSEVSFVVRANVDAAAVLPAIRDAISESGADRPVYNVRTMQQLVAGSIARQRFSMLLLTAFAAVALLLATVGTYGVISYGTARRVPEIGVRMALGARRSDVLRSVISQGLRLAATGVAIGAVIVLVLARALSSFSRLLYGVQATDPLTLALVAIALLASAALACYLPARRAANIDPLAALRDE